MTGNAPTVTMTLSPAGPYAPGDQITATASVVDADSYTQQLTGVDDLGASFSEVISHVDPEQITWSWASGATIAPGVNPLAVPAPAQSDTLVCVVVDAQGHSVMTAEPVTITPPMLVGVDAPDTAAMLKTYPGARITRVFGSPGKGIPAWSSAQMKACVAAGVLPHVSFKDTPTAAMVNAWMDAIPAGAKAWVTFHHEPEGDLAPADYAAGWATLAQLVAAHPKHAQVTLVGVLTYYAETHGKGPWQTWVTGHEQMIGIDQYVTLGQPLPAPAVFFALLDQIAAATGLPVCVPELGAQPTTAGYGPWLASCFAYGRQRRYRSMSVWSTKGTNGVDYTLVGAALTTVQQAVAAQ